MKNPSKSLIGLLIDSVTTSRNATSFVLNTIDLCKVNEFGYAIEVTEADMFDLIGDNENLLRVANITANINIILENGGGTATDVFGKYTLKTEEGTQKITFKYLLVSGFINRYSRIYD